MVKRGVNKAGQVTIFVILAIVLVVAGVSYFIFKDTLFPKKVSTTFEPIETSFLNCIQEKAQTGIKILESKGGYISNPEFIPGSQYMPFSSQLDFLGVGIPYWRSISGNNLQINQVPTKEEMQNQLVDYLNQQIQNCNFNSFTQDNFNVVKGTPDSQVTINDNNVQVFLTMDLQVSKGNESAVLSTHQAEVNSNLGALYNDAIQFYNQENKEMFLENYSIDFLRTYAPVDGFDLSCSPKVWNANEIFDTLKNATQDNFYALKNSQNKTDYFNLKLPISSSVRILNSRNWPSTYEVSPADSQTMVANPIGNQPGLGILGFCYVPYHFVYSLKYPVLVQLSQDGETFQFPLSINIENNFAKPFGNGTAVVDNSVDLCKGAKSNVTVNLVDSNGKPVEGNVTYSCFDSSCDLGSTQGGSVRAEFPQCVNGKIIAKSEGYKDSTHIFSTVQGGSTAVVMSKIYDKQISLNLKNSVGNEKAIINFVSSDSSDSHTVIYPETKDVNLSEGIYQVQVYVYDNSSLKFDATTTQQCFDVPSGVFGLFGITHQECTQVPVPAQNITNVLVAGGKSQVSFSDDDLKGNNKIEISLDRYKTPSSLQELQIIYTLADAKSVGVKFI